MGLLRSVMNAFVDALFPLAEAEEAIRALAPEEAMRALPPAPPYDHSVARIEGAVSLFAYKDERVSKLVWSVKYKKDPRAIAIGGYALYTELEKIADGAPIGQKIILIPIPITSWRRRERGYNQCELLLDEISRLDIGKKFLYEKDLLVRVRHRSRQTLKGRGERLASASGIFAVDRAGMDGLKSSASSSLPLAIVIDDVLTTGSTMREAVDALQHAGFDRVTCLTLAH